MAILLMFINNLVPICLTIVSLVYAEDMFRYTVCMGRQEIFLYDLEDLLADVGIPLWDYGRGISLPLYHPLRLFTNIFGLSVILVVPVAYIAIYSFRKKHDRQVPGTTLFL